MDMPGLTPLKMVGPDEVALFVTGHAGVAAVEFPGGAVGNAALDQAHARSRAAPGDQWAYVGAFSVPPLTLRCLALATSSGIHFAIRPPE